MQRLSSKQQTVFDWLAERDEGTFDLNDVIALLYPRKKFAPANPRTCAASVVQALADKFDCQCCFIDRITPIGRGHKATYRFKLGCSKQ